MVVIWRLTLAIHTLQGSISHGSYICNSDSMVVSFCNYQQGYEMITTNRCLCHNICAVVVWARICNVIVPNNGIAMNPDPKNIRLKEYLIIFRRLIHKFDSNLWCSAFAHRMPQDQSHRMAFFFLTVVCRFDLIISNPNKALIIYNQNKPYHRMI